jgi:hypothetical protein
VSHRSRTIDPLSREERDRLIAALRDKGWTTAKIAARVGMSRQGVEAALRRLTGDPERYWEGWTLETRPLDSR